jgi:serpin B
MKKLSLILIVLILFSACSWFDEDPIAQQGVAQFGVSNTYLQKSSSTPMPDHVRISYLNSESELITDELELSLFNTTYLSEPLMLTTGDYSLEEFIVCDGNDSVIYLSPKMGSDKAELVTEPLPIIFTILKDSTTQIVPQVVRVDINDTPEDFGYTEFGFDIVGDKEGFVRCMNQFGIDVFKELAANPVDSSQNNFISPISLDYALGMLLNGSGGGTLDMLKDVMHLNAYTDAEMNALYKQYKKFLYEQGSEVEIALAHAIWYRPGFEVLNSYLSTCRYYFDSEVSELDFAGNPQGAADSINQWCADNTNDRIDHVVDAVEMPSKYLVLGNATYFKGDFIVSMDTSMTMPADFYASDGDTVTCDMMFSQGVMNVKRYHDDNIEVVSIPFGNEENYLMTMIMPEGPIDEFVGSIDIQDWEYWMDNSSDDGIFLCFPKIKVDTLYNMKKTMSALGASELFTNPDLSRMTNDGGLFVGTFKHATFLSVDEKGAEAAAVTIIGMDIGIHYNDHVNFNKPFLLIIQEADTKALLFMGRFDKVKQVED